MASDKSLFGKIKNIFSTPTEEPKPKWDQKDWIEIKAPTGSQPSKPVQQQPRGLPPSQQPTSHSRGPAVPQSAHHVRPTTKERIQKERTTFSGKDPAKPVERMSPDELKKKWPGAFDGKR